MPLREAFEAAPDGAVYVVSKSRSQADGNADWRHTNLRTRMERIVAEAGLTARPRLFHALRASCETELVERFPVQTVTASLGNSPKVALKHYLRVLPEHFAKATERPKNVAQESDAHSDAQCSGTEGNRRVADSANPAIFPTIPHGCQPEADGVGFEPTLGLRLNRFSRPGP